MKPGPRTGTHPNLLAILLFRPHRRLTMVVAALAISMSASWPAPAVVQATSPQTYTVTSTSDTDDGCDADCSLREAINAANTHANVGGPDTIEFALSGSGPHVIAPTSALPTISSSVILDATTEPGPGGAPGVTIDGVSASLVSGITISGSGAAGTVVKGLAIVRFTSDTSSPTPGNGVSVSNAADVIISDNYLGTDGTADLGNGRAGVSISGSPRAQIRGNLISGNGSGSGCCSDGFGVYVSGVTSTGVVVEGNRIGTNAAGTADLGNKTYGVWIQSGGNTVGGTTAAAANVVSGNDWGGVNLQSPAANNTVRGNLIGLDVTGSALLGNLNHGVLLNGAGLGNVIRENVIAGHGAGILLGSTSGARIEDNLIGPSADGTTLLGNPGIGLQIGSFSNNNTVVGNAIRGNGSGISHAGILIQSTATGNVITGNEISDNRGDGVQLFATSGNTVGGTAVGEGNLIESNTKDGISQVSGGTGNRFLANRIDANGTIAGDLGIDLANNGLTTNDAGDADTGANDLQNYPVLGPVTTTAISGSLDSAAGSYRIEFFRVSACDASGNGQGTTYLGALDPQAAGSFSFAASLAPGDIITATATSLTTGDTSEFSACEAAIASDACTTVTDDALEVVAPPPDLRQGATTSDTRVILFDEQHGMTIGSPLAVDIADPGCYDRDNAPVAGLSLPAGTVVDSHFLHADRATPNAIIDLEGTWTFAGDILGVHLGDDALDGGDAPFGWPTVDRYPTDFSNRGSVAGPLEAVDWFRIHPDRRTISFHFQFSSALDQARILTEATEAAPSIAIDDVDVTEGDSGTSLAPFTVTLSAASGHDVSVSYATSGGTATSGTDFESASGRLSIPAGQTTGAINVTINGDIADESNEAYTVTLSEPANAVLGDAAGTGTIVDDDDSEAPSLTVNTTDDLVDAGGCTTVHCSLREAIARANSLTGADTIDFDIPAAMVGGAHSIAPSTALPAVTGATIIDGTTEPDFVDCTTGPIVVIDGANAGSAHGIHLAGGASTVRGLVINGFDGFARGGIYLKGSGGHVVECNYIGTDVAGTVALGNDTNVLIESPDNRIGGTTVDERNLISGSTRDSGVLIQDNGSGTVTHFATRNVVLGNYIGTDVTGTFALGNRIRGVMINGPDGNTVGGTAPGAGNLVSGNIGIGIAVGSADNVVQGNLVGTTADGSAGLGNTSVGISVSGPDNLIGGSVPGAGNVVADSGQHGIGVCCVRATGNVIAGNRIGTDGTGATALGNTGFGVVVNGDASTNLIGGTAAGAGNLISGNAGQGVLLDGPGTTANVLAGNRIGTAADGTSPLGNTAAGVYLSNQANGNVIGGTSVGSGNVIAFNGGDGVFVSAAGGPCCAVSNRIQGNSIHGNTGLGIDLDPNGVTANDAGDPDTGANRRQNFPVLGSVTTASIGGTLDGTAAAYRIEFFRVATCDVSANGEGQTFLGARDPQGPGAFSFSTTLAAGDIVTATATDLATGDTSEFSACATAVADEPSLVVNTTTDTIDAGGCTVAHCSLREAILRANDLAGADNISFDIPGAGPHTIRPTTALPVVTDPVIIDGTTEPDFESCAAGPVIELDGGAAGASANGLRITAGTSTVRGLVINRFSETGVWLETGDANRIECNYIGTDLDGSAAAPNGTGIYLFESAANTVGGDSTDERNVISGNLSLGVFAGLGAEAADNVISGNFIGTDATGTADLGNGYGGIALSSPRNRIGGTGPGEGNVISGNDYLGIQIGLNSYSDATDNLVQGNFIGTDVAGTAAIGNAQVGVIITNYPDNTIGGTAPGAGNLISGNDRIGVRIENPASSGNLVAGNRIGTDITGTADLGNGTDGVAIFFAPDNAIGGTSVAAGNVISGNGGAGVHINGTAATSGNLVQGNRIGSTADGSGSIPNTTGIQILGAAGNTVGGTGSGAGNLIVGSVADGVRLAFGATSNTILSNRIHTNGDLGIDLDPDGVTANDTGDVDTGVNALQNYPVLGPVTTTSIGGSLDAAAGAYRLEFFRNATCDPSGNGEGAEFLGALDPQAPGPFSFATTLAVGDIVTATATNMATGDTSEFSACATAVLADVCEPGASAIAFVDPPASVDEGGRESDTQIVLFEEQQSLTLAAPLAIDLNEPGCYDNAASPTQPDPIPAGTVIDSYMLHADNASEPSVKELFGSWTFDSDILGVIVTDGRLDASDAVSGWPYTDYPVDYPYRGAVLSPDENADWLEISPDGRTIHLFLQFSSAIDQVRVITAGSAGPTLSIDDVTVAEGDSGMTDATFTVSLSGASSDTVKVTFGSADGTAAAPADYTATSGVLTFAPGQTIKTVAVPIVGDLVDEPHETYTVGLTSAANASVADSSGLGTITDDDPTPGTIVIVKDAVPDSATDVTFTDTIPDCAVGPLDDDADATRSNTATCSSVLPGTYSVTESDPAPSTLRDIDCDDADSTGNTTTRTASIALSEGETVTCTFTNSGDLPTLSINDISITEGNAGPTTSPGFQVTLSAPSSTTVTVNYGSADGSATAIDDYLATSGTLTFAPGVTSQPIPVTVVGDIEEEHDEHFFVDLSAPSGATIADGRGKATILDEATDICTIVGTSAGETLIGTDGPDVICGRGGNDILNGKAGNDRFYGSDPLPDGTDRLADGDNDTVTFDGAPNGVSATLITPATAAGWGSDDLYGIENLTGSDHDDRLTGNGLANVLSGGLGNDVLDGRAGNDGLHGGGGGDDWVLFDAAPAAVNVDLSDQFAQTASGWGSDVLTRIENIRGTVFDDTFQGSAADNRFEAGNGARDRIRFSDAPNGVDVNLNGQVSTGWGHDNLIGVEDITGSPFGDDLTGSDIVNHIAAGGGPDTVNGRDGSDILHGGAGTDRVSYAGAPSPGVKVDLPNGFSREAWGNDTLTDFENIYGSAFSDTLLGDGGRNEIFGDGGGDTIRAGGGNDFIHAGQGNDSIFGDAGNDEIYGDDGDDGIRGGDGDDVIAGNDGADIIDADAGNDQVSGGNGADSIKGGTGNDTLVGGPSPPKDTLNGEAGTDTCIDGPGIEDTKLNCELFT